MSEQPITPVGLTKTQGWEMGIRRTLPLTPAQAWLLLVTPPGLTAWFGTIENPIFAKKAQLESAEGVKITVVSYEEGSLLRMRWQPAGSDQVTTLQIRVTAAKTGTTISFHHEKLADGEQRAAMLRHWSGVLDHLASLI